MTKEMQEQGKTALNKKDQTFIASLFATVSYISPLYCVELDGDSEIEFDLGGASRPSAAIDNDEDAEDEEEAKRGPTTRTFKVKDQKTADAINQRLHRSYGIEPTVELPQIKGILRTAAAELGRKLHKYDKKATRLGYLGTVDAGREVLRKLHLTRFTPQSFPGPFEHRIARDLKFSAGVHAAGRNTNFRELVESWVSERGSSNIPGLKRKQHETTAANAYQRRALPKAAPTYHVKASHTETQWKASSTWWSAYG